MKGLAFLYVYDFPFRAASLPWSVFLNKSAGWIYSSDKASKSNKREKRRVLSSGFLLLVVGAK